MRDLSAKVSSLREARASATLRVSPASIELIKNGKAPKGDPLPIARVAAIQAAKNTPQTIPYCHPVPVDYVGVEFTLYESTIDVVVEVRAVYKTGVEMEALTAATAAVLNLFDLLKPVDLHMEIESVRLLEKTGGKTQFALAETFSARVIVVSDSVSSGGSVDRSGASLADMLEAQGGNVAAVVVSPDEIESIIQCVQSAMGEGGGAPDLIVLTGGTGIGPRDVTPEAVIPLLTTRLEGVEHRLHAFGQVRLPTAMMGRPFAGLIGSTIVVGLPGSPGAVQDAVASLFPYLKHAFHIVRGGGHGC